ncbi:hypothetical protein SCHPADRAFT_147271 [Schizopora paradoxa]|uniref:Uncharacterized protein n=1 Tax=Schizopora paradoxa TaxID=27342 RepID=A0A0H2S145_9AGAM|nr:hypothetical protein SCHPADRAFT_147271 [Schizopora paradoxa]
MHNYLDTSLFALTAVFRKHSKRDTRNTDRRPHAFSLWQMGLEIMFIAVQVAMLIDDSLVAGVIRASHHVFFAVEPTSYNSFGGISIGSSGNREVRPYWLPASSLRRCRTLCLKTNHDCWTASPLTRCVVAPLPSWLVFDYNLFERRRDLRIVVRRSA